MISGVYEIEVQHFGDKFHYTLDLLEKDRQLYGCLRTGSMSLSLYNGMTIQSPGETEPHNFIFHRGQVDDYVNLKLPNGETTTLCPPGGYHENGILFGGTVADDTIVATFTLREMLVISVYGHRIPGEPVVNQTEIRRDGLPGKNLYCTCGTGTCTHRGYCDCCQIFELLHTAMMPRMREDIPNVPLCMTAQTNKLFGITREEAGKLFAPPPQTMEVNGEKRPAHGAHHLKDENYTYKL